MRLTELLNNFLQSFYIHFTPSLEVDDQAAGSSFYESVIEPAVRLPEFRKRLLEEPAAVLSEMGIMLPEGMVIQFLENTEDTMHIVIPPYVGE